MQVCAHDRFDLLAVDRFHLDLVNGHGTGSAKESDTDDTMDGGGWNAKRFFQLVPGFGPLQGADPDGGERSAISVIEADCQSCEFVDSSAAGNIFRFEPA